MPPRSVSILQETKPPAYCVVCAPCEAAQCAALRLQRTSNDEHSSRPCDRLQRARDIACLRVDGEPMSEDDWQQGFVKSLMVFLNGDALQELDDDGKRVRASFGGAWTVVVDTATEVGERHATLAAGAVARIEARSVIVLTRP
jgi:isoamylase